MNPFKEIYQVSVFPGASFQISQADIKWNRPKGLKQHVKPGNKERLWQENGSSLLEIHRFPSPLEVRLSCMLPD